MFVRARVCITLGLLAAAAACGSDSTNTKIDTANCTATNQVTMKNIKFVPACIKIQAGTKVTFTNTESVAHNTTAVSGQTETFASGTMNLNDTFEHTFTAAGTVAVTCTFHNGMNMSVVVE